MSFRLSSLPGTSALTRSSLPTLLRPSITPIRLQTRTAISSQEVPRMIARKRDKKVPLEKSLAAKVLVSSPTPSAASHSRTD